MQKKQALGRRQTDIHPSGDHATIQGKMNIAPPGKSRIYCVRQVQTQKRVEATSTHHRHHVAYHGPWQAWRAPSARWCEQHRD